MFKNYFDKETESDIYKDIIDNSPAEILLLEMKPGPKQFNILYINNTKINEFNIIDKEKVINKKCYEVFEPYRKADDKEEGHCLNCPAYEAFTSGGKTIHRDWRYIHPLKKEIRYGSITARRIPNTTKVVEICRDSTIRKRISDLTIELGRAKSFIELENILIKGFLEQLYFERCRIYVYLEDENLFVLKSFKKVFRGGDQSGYKIKDVEFDKIELNSETSQADKYIIENQFKSKPRYYYIKERLSYNHLNFSHFIPLNNDEYYDNPVLNKQDYPIWLDIPLIRPGKIMGKISLDKKISENETLNFGIDDYDLEILGLFALSIGQSLDNIRLLDISKLHEINEIVLKSNKINIDPILNQILDKGCEYLGFSQGTIIIN